MENDLKIEKQIEIQKIRKNNEEKIKNWYYITN